MATFKAGDTVICVDCQYCTNLTAGKEYTIASVDHTKVFLLDDSGQETSYYAARFVSARTLKSTYVVECVGSPPFRAECFKDVEAYCRAQKRDCNVYKLYATVSPVTKLEIQYLN